MSSMRQQPSAAPLARAWATVAVGDAPARFELCSSAGRRTVDTRPDFEMASKWTRALKRVHHVEIHEPHDDAGWTAWIHGTGHRTPTTRRISVSTAVALGLRHVPLVLALDGTPAR
ncbi:MAG: hypothetical protein R8G01_19960 [Ilumatobacteraceae bacterium]|nr:hypothetical protein [Ilumatobacteraceae bacterium]